MKALRGKELVRLLERHGWGVARVHGSHYVLKKEGEPRVITVPVYGRSTLKVGMQKQILKMAGISEAEVK
jgi:predicted RNA binding protein YcfA (HicA-like mRNA interferase family)